MISRSGFFRLALASGAFVLPAVTAAAPPEQPAATTVTKAPSALPAVRPRTNFTFQLTSQEGLDYSIFVSAPEGPPPAAGFPVLYVLDANAWFGIAAEITRLYELEGGPAIVVGVGYPVETLYAPQRRGHDFTLGPPKSGEMSVYEGTQFGGADRFLTFLKGQLRDEVAARYAIDRSRQSLFGHSLGGYFVAHVLLTHPDAFSAYIGASPALWWDMASLAHEEGQARRGPRPTKPPAVLIAVGEAEQRLGAADENLFRRLYAANPKAFGGKALDQVLEETRAGMAKSRMVDNARDFAARLTAMGMPAQFVAFTEENHRSVVAPALGRGMTVVFP